MSCFEDDKADSVMTVEAKTQDESRNLAPEVCMRLWRVCSISDSGSADNGRLFLPEVDHD